MQKTTKKYIFKNAGSVERVRTSAEKVCKNNFSYYYIKIKKIKIKKF